MRVLPTTLRRQLEGAVVEGRRAAEGGVRAALSSLGAEQRERPAHLDEQRARLRRGLRAKQRQLGGGFDVLVWECAYEQWHRLLFARFLAENGLLRHPAFGVSVTLAECDELAGELGEPDGWAVAARFAAEILPGIFRLDDPCVQLRLAPEHRVALERIVEALPGEVFAADDSLGWVYQYWQSERKDEVNASEVKIGGADLGPVTQLFTENYMVRFLLENSLGAWWAARYPDSPLIDGFEYLRFDEEGRPAAGAFEGWPDRVAEVTVMDPCCGSGHFLVEAFGMLWRMRAEEEGLDPVAAQDAVLRDNLFGLELDPRCVQIAMFAVALQAWKAGGGWRVLPTPNIACSGIPAKAPLAEWTALGDGDARLERALERLHGLFRDADTLGSLIDPRRATEGGSARGTQGSLDDIGFDEVAPLLEKAAARETDDPATAVLGADAAGTAHAAQLLSRTYTLITTNVPYLGRMKQATVLRQIAEAQLASGKEDLASMFLVKSLRMVQGCASVVVPETLTFLNSMEPLRRDLLETCDVRFVAALGAGAFSNIQGEVVRPALTIVSPHPNSSGAVTFVDVTSERSNSKSRGLVAAPLSCVSKMDIIRSPEMRLVSGYASAGSFLKDVARSVEGMSSGDDSRFTRSFWEHGTVPPWWIVFQGAPDVTRPYGGLDKTILWDNGKGALANSDGARLQGLSCWGLPGIVVERMSSLRATIYYGAAFQKSVTVVQARRTADLPAVWAFCRSGTHKNEVLKFERRIGIATSSIVQVPFDLDYWRARATEEFPEGLPEPWSDDPTQWLFEGRPEEATEPLQVAVGRLVGYRWPEQPDADDLDGFADVDGIVCVPAVAGELPAADRLQALLARAYGDEWSLGLVRRLLEQTGSKKKDLAGWLRDDFFKQHCKVFSNRPFVWHVWDGRKDGFSALVNYHRLDRAGLEKLTYTYLGDWIERQRAAAGEDVTGADVRLAAARDLRRRLEAILDGEPPYDIYVRWKPLSEQPVGWDPDLDDGVRLNIRPFVEAGVLRSRVNVHWKKDRGKNPDGSERLNDLHYTRAQKHQARQQAGRQ